MTNPSEGKVESGLVVWRCPQCGKQIGPENYRYWAGSKTWGHYHNPPTDETWFDAEQVSVTPTADIEERLPASLVRKDAYQAGFAAGKEQATADVRELVEAGNALDAAIDENHPWKLGAASANWKDASAKHPTYGEGE